MTVVVFCYNAFDSFDSYNLRQHVITIYGRYVLITIHDNCHYNLRQVFWKFTTPFVTSEQKSPKGVLYSGPVLQRVCLHISWNYVASTAVLTDSRRNSWINLYFIIKRGRQKGEKTSKKVARKQNQWSIYLYAHSSSFIDIIPNLVTHKEPKEIILNFHIYSICD